MPNFYTREVEDVMSSRLEDTEPPTYRIQVRSDFKQSKWLSVPESVITALLAALETLED